MAFRLPYATAFWVVCALFFVGFQPVFAADTHFFAKRDGRALALDFYRPDVPGADLPASGAPAIVYVHGGGWTAGSRADLPDFLKALTGAGYAVAAPDYRLVPEAAFAGMVADIKAALAYLGENAALLGIDPDRLVLWGHSAGGHLALLAGLTDPARWAEASMPRPAAIVAYAAPVDLSQLVTDCALADCAGQPGTRSDPVTLMLGCPPAACPGEAALASPVTHLDVADPPVILVHGEGDDIVPVAQARRFAAESERIGHFSHLTEVMQGGHAGLPAPVHAAAIRVLDRVLSAAAARSSRR